MHSQVSCQPLQVQQVGKLKISFQNEMEFRIAGDKIINIHFLPAM